MEEQEGKISSYIEQHEDLKSTVSTSNGNGCTMPVCASTTKVVRKCRTTKITVREFKKPTKLPAFNYMIRA